MGFDANTALEEINSSNVLFENAYSVDRGKVHQYVECAFLRGNMGIWELSGDLSESNELNSKFLHSLPYIKGFLESLPGVLGRVALLKLGSKSVIPIHRDNHKYFTQALRFHVPIRTNDKVFFFNNGNIFQMKEGEVWSIDNLGRHAVVNNGEEERLHMVIDIYIDNEVVKLLDNANSSLGTPAKNLPEIFSAMKESPEEKLRRAAERKKQQKLATNEEKIKSIDMKTTLKINRTELKKSAKKHGIKFKKDKNVTLAKRQKKDSELLQKLYDRISIIEQRMNKRATGVTK